jgi:hypothetical protein
MLLQTVSKPALGFGRRLGCFHATCSILTLLPSEVLNSTVIINLFAYTPNREDKCKEGTFKVTIKDKPYEHDFKVI